MSLTKVQINLGTTGNLSGSRSLASGSFASRITTAETELTNTILSSSVQIGTDISGSFGGQRVGTTDSPTFNAITVGTATVTGTLTAQEIHSEFESASILFTSGSTHFGNSSDDTHNMTGSLNVSGGINLNDGTLTVTDNVDFNGDLDVDGTTNLDVVDIDGAVDMASTLTVANQTFIGGTADEGYSLLLNIEGAGGTDDVPGILFKNTSASNNEEIMSLLGAQGSDSVAAINIKREANADDAYIDFMTQANGGSMTERLRITSAGHVSASGNISIIKGNAMLNVEEVGGSKAYLFSGGSFTALRTTSNTPIHFGANYSSADDMFIDGSGKVGVNESSFSYTDYAVFHIKGRGSDDGNATGMTFHVGSSNSDSRNWSITTNNSTHGAMDFRVSEANNNTPNTNLVLKLQKESKISLSNNDSGTSNTIFGKNAGASLDAGSNYNTFIGEGVSDASMNDATDNVGVGYQALSALTTGDDNVAVGMRALLDLEGGNKNTGLGDSAGRGVTSGEENVMVGHQAGDAITSGGANVVVGVNAAGAGNVNYITAIGREAARDVNSTDANGTTVVGTNALAALTSGQANTAVGYQAIGSNCDVGDFNTAVGYQALKVFDPGSDGHGSNTAVGYRAGYSVSTSENNTFMGARAGEATTGAGNVIIGREAGLAMTSGADCVIIGHAAGGANNTRDGLVIIGSSAGAALTSGDANTFVGGGAGRLVSSGDHNTLLGYQVGYNLHSAGSHNTLIGKQAGLNMNASGDGNNVALGSETADTITSGTNNTILGTASDAAAGAVNQIVIGYGVVGQGDNYAVIGNGSQTRLYIGDDQGGQLFAGTSTINTSDRRIKKDIEDSDLGLNFINKLRPITYRKKEVIDYDDSLKTKMSWYKNNTPPRVLDEEQKEKIRLGFIAQEVGEVLQDLGFSENNEIVQIDENTTQQGLAYERFVPTLVKAVQELSQKIDNIEKKCKCMNEN